MTPTSTPSAAQTLLLRAGLLEGEAARSAWAAWTARVDLEDIDAESNRLLPLVYKNLRRAGVTDLPARLAGAYKQAWTKNTFAFRAATRALGALAAAGIPTLVLKGAALALLHYRDNGVRAMDDVDLLVPRPRVKEAEAVLTAAGWRCERDELSDAYLSTHQSCGFIDPKGSNVDLHWHASQDALRAEADVPLWQAAVPLMLGDHATRALCPTDLLLHVCAHAYFTQDPHLRWLADAATVLRTAPIDVDRLLARARARGLVGPLKLALALLRDDLGVAVPRAIEAALASEPVPLLDRLEHELNVSRRPYTVSKVLVRLWCWHRRSSSARGPALLATFPDFLRRYYDLPSAWSVAAHGLARARKRAGEFGL